MAVNRSLWLAHFDASTPPRWPCPACGGSLQYTTDTLSIRETKESRLARAHEDWDPEWTERRFTCVLECSRKECGETVAVVGNEKTSFGWQGEDEEGETRSLSPLLAVPMPRVFDVPDKCPPPILIELEKSFALIWLDPASAANHARAAVELLMDYLGVRKVEITKGDRKRKYLSLHRRIILFQKREPALGSALLAVKWIGNSGSHPSGVQVLDIFDAYDILEHALEELIGRRSYSLRRLATGINRRRTPQSKQRARKPLF